MADRYELLPSFVNMSRIVLNLLITMKSTAYAKFHFEFKPKDRSYYS